MKKYLFITLYIISLFNLDICYSFKFPSISLQQFSSLLTHKSCIDFSELLESKYGINFIDVKFLRRENFKGTCQYLGKLSKVIKLRNSVRVISFGFMSDHQFFLFKKYNRQYIYIGKISTYLKYGAPVINSYNFPRETIYSVVSYSDGGTGLMDTDWVFYRLFKNKKSSEIFSVSKEGYIYGWGSSFNRSYSSKIIKKTSHNNMLEIEYDINYSLNRPFNEKSPDLFGTRKTLLLKYENHTFSLSKNSPNTFEEINDIMGHEEGYFCENYPKHLKTLLASKDNNIRLWSKKMIGICKSNKKLNDKKITYTIQVGAFKSEANTNKLGKKIRLLLPKAKIFSWKGGGKNNYRIISIGRFDSKESAQSYKLSLINKFKNMSFVVRELP